jgi:putative DNA primase/helicase
MIDFKSINATALQFAEAILVAMFPLGKRRGPEFVVGSLNGEAGKSLSINIHTGKWADFAAGQQGGDLTSLLAAKEGISQPDAAKKLAAMIDSPIMEPLEKDDDGFTPTSVLPEFAEPVPVHPKHGLPWAWYTYKGAKGEILGYILRFEKNGKKTFAPYTPWLDDNLNVVWRWKSFAKPRPLYGLDKLAQNPAARVLIVEGEKCVQALQEMFLQVVVISWPGGASGFRSVNWLPLAERDVVIWPDNDEPGKKAAEGIADILSNSASKVQVIKWHGDYPEGHDGWDIFQQGPEAVREFLKRGLEPDPEPESAVVQESEPMQEARAPFRILGYDKGSYFYLPNGSAQIVSLGANEHRELQLLQLAPANWWEGMFAGENGANWKAAANSLIQQAHRTGVFSPRSIRGRGAWIDENRVVYHLGDKLLVDGQLLHVHEFQTSFVYELSHRTPCPTNPAAINAEAAKLIELCELMAWKNKLNAKLFAGWLVLAPIAGVLGWRPHIWLNGPSGSGKSWILFNVLLPMLGRGVINVQSATTEAGIRQILGSDSLPVILDEAETEDKVGQMRIQKILELARGCSSETGASIVKGSASGNAMEFMLRTCFCFSSIGVAAVMRSDVSRITPLELFKRNDTASFDRLKELRNVTTGNPDWCDSLRARALANAVTIRDNALVFASAVAAFLGDQRSGDQLGTLLAGAFSLTSTKKVTPEFASQWVSQQDWTTWETTDIDRDEHKALSTLLDYLIKVDGDLNETLSVGELLDGAFAGNEKFNQTLIRNGIKPTDSYVAVSNSHSSVARIFANTPWAGKWKDQFLRVPGASAGRERFYGAQQRVCCIPNEAFQA